MSFTPLTPVARAGKMMMPAITSLLILFLTGWLGLAGHIWAEDATDSKFTSAPAVAARGRYLLVVEQAKTQKLIDLKAALKDSMQLGQLDEANRISKAIENPGDPAGVSFTSTKAQGAQVRYATVTQRAMVEYVAALKGAMAQSLRAAQLDESNRISAEIKGFEADNARHADATTGFINLLPLIDPAKDTVAGKWAMEKGALVSSGSGEERIEIPYQPPSEYDFRIVFTKTGTNCVIQMLSQAGAPFIWGMGADGSYSFRYLKGTGTGANKTTVKKPPGIKDNHRYTSLVRVRKNGVEALLDGRVMTKWDTDYSDVESAPWWALRDKSLLGLGTGSSKTEFHTIEVKEVTGSGKMMR